MMPKKTKAKINVRAPKRKAPDLYKKVALDVPSMRIFDMVLVQTQKPAVKHPVAPRIFAYNTTVRSARPAQAPRLFQKAISFAMLIIILTYTFGFNFTKAQYLDSVASTGNSFTASSLLFNLSSPSNFSPNITPTTDANRQIIMTNAGGLGFKYRAKAQNVSGTLCSSLNLITKLDTVQVSSSTLSSFDQAPFTFTAPEVWDFTARLNSQDVNLYNTTCNFDIVYSAWQTTIAEGAGGFTDVLTVSSTVTAGTWSPSVVLNEVMWMGTTLQSVLVSPSVSNGGFESNLTTWGSGSKWGTTTTAPHGGTKSAQVTGSSNDSNGILSKTVSTSGLTKINLSYWYRLDTSIESNDHLYVEWSSNGTTWNPVQDISNLNANSNWALSNFNLPVGAENQSSFQIRFRSNFTSNGQDTDVVSLDDVSIIGYQDNATDEWIELKNTTGSSIDISNWTINSAGAGSAAIAIPASSSIPSNGFYLISHNAANASAINNSVTVDRVDSSISLADAGEQLVLKNASNTPIDKTTTGAWPAGVSQNSPTVLRQSMERNATPGDGTISTNWHTCIDTACNDTIYWDAEAANYGTPKITNLSDNDLSINPFWVSAPQEQSLSTPVEIFFVDSFPESEEIIAPEASSGQPVVEPSTETPSPEVLEEGPVSEPTDETVEPVAENIPVEEATTTPETIEPEPVTPEALANATASEISPITEPSAPEEDQTISGFIPVITPQDVDVPAPVEVTPTEGGSNE